MVEILEVAVLGALAVLFLRLRKRVEQVENRTFANQELIHTTMRVLGFHIKAHTKEEEKEDATL